MALDEDPRILFRSVRQSLGRGKHAGKNANNIVVMGTEMPQQVLFYFPEPPETAPPRLVLGRESYWLQGFPIKELEAEWCRHLKPLGS